MVSTLKYNIIQLIGEYIPTGDTFANADWAYIFSGIILCIMIYWIFRMFNSILFK